MEAEVTDMMNDLISDHVGYAKGLARQFFLEKPQLIVCQDEFESAALLGLCDAAKRYDERKGFGFKSFAYLRIRGAIIDMLRHSSGIGRSYFVDIVRHDADLSMEFPDRTIPESKLANPLPYKFARSPKELESLSPLFFESGMTVILGRFGKTPSLCYCDDPSPEFVSLKSSVNRYMQSIIARLPHQERKIVEMRYFEGKSYEEIGSELQGRSKSWISRIHARAIVRLRSMIARGSVRNDLMGLQSISAPTVH